MNSLPACGEGQGGASPRHELAARPPNPPPAAGEGATARPPTLHSNVTRDVSPIALNKIVGENDVINAETLPKVRMPNRDGFVSRYPDKH